MTAFASSYFRTNSASPSRLTILSLVDRLGLRLPRNLHGRELPLTKSGAVLLLLVEHGLGMGCPLDFDDL